MTHKQIRIKINKSWRELKQVQNQAGDIREELLIEQAQFYADRNENKCENIV